MKLKAYFILPRKKDHTCAMKIKNYMMYKLNSRTNWICNQQGYFKIIIQLVKKTMETKYNVIPNILNDTSSSVVENDAKVTDKQSLTEKSKAAKKKKSLKYMHIT